MAYVPKPVSGTKVLKMTPPWNGSVAYIILVCRDNQFVQW
jgi:hypothetical protein